jgi:hypothetical protein
MKTVLGYTCMQYALPSHCSSTAAVTICSGAPLLGTSAQEALSSYEGNNLVAAKPCMHAR